MHSAEIATQLLMSRPCKCPVFHLANYSLVDYNIIIIRKTVD